jgi:hypothetical protein
MGIKRRCGVRWENIHDPESSTTVSSYSNRLRIASANPSDSSMLDIIIFRLCPPPLATRTLPSPTRDSVTDFLSSTPRSLEWGISCRTNERNL